MVEYFLHAHEQLDQKPVIFVPNLMNNIGLTESVFFG